QSSATPTSTITMMARRLIMAYHSRQTADPTPSVDGPGRVWRLPIVTDFSCKISYSKYIQDGYFAQPPSLRTGVLKAVVGDWFVVSGSGKGGAVAGRSTRPDGAVPRPYTAFSGLMASDH